MSEERITLPTFSWHALTAVALLFAQFVGVVIWAQNEHSSRIELEHRFNAYTLYMDNTMRDIAAASAKREDRIDRIDNFGTRPEVAIGQRINTLDARLAEILDRSRKLEERMSDLDHKR